MKKTLKRLCTGFLALATVVTALPTTPVHAESKQYWTESKDGQLQRRAGYAVRPQVAGRGARDRL